jgi:acid phosphatase (class A)
MMHRLSRTRCLSRAFGALVILLAAAGSSVARDAYYASAPDVDLIHVLPAPPKPDSDVAKKDLDTVLAEQSARTEEKVAAARADQLRSVFQLADALGPGFKRDNLPFASTFFKHVGKDGKRDISPVKSAYERPRPPSVDSRVQPVTRIPRDSSYPSAHAAFAGLMGTLLTAMVPEKAKEIEARTKLYAYRRVIAGAHFPSDTEAGMVAGKAIAARMMQNPKFVADFERAKIEVRAALQLKSASNGG